MKVEISTGELLDKISILQIKQRKIEDEEITKELSLLRKQVKLKMETWIVELQNINEQLWEVEDKIREKEKAHLFDDDFIFLARQVYKLNDQRFALKKQINEIFKSKIKEVKSYK